MKIHMYRLQRLVQRGARCALQGLENAPAAAEAPSAAGSAGEAPVPAEEEDVGAAERRELQAMLRFGPSIVVADEGHRMKNDEGFFSQCMELVATRRRIVLTGYPLQNHLQECALGLCSPEHAALLSAWRFAEAMPASRIQ